MAPVPDDETLYVTLSDMNAVAVVDVEAGEVRGYLATGWYPSALAVVADGKKLLVANAKGTSVRNPNDKPDQYDPKRKHAYILSLLEGNMSLLDIPSGDALEKSTAEVLANNRLDKLAEIKTRNPQAGIGPAAGAIKHVIYIIKENRTYDETLGDLPQGNGDPALVLFGRDVTPNQHALAERFVLMDNLYACGEVSGDGWCWSTQGMADAYVSRNVPYSYSRRGACSILRGPTTVTRPRAFQRRMKMELRLQRTRHSRMACRRCLTWPTRAQYLGCGERSRHKLAQLRFFPVRGRQCGRDERGPRQLSLRPGVAPARAQFGRHDRYRLSAVRHGLPR